MAKITTLETKVLLNDCLGFDNPDASDGVLYQAKAKNRITANAEQRALIIGLGGQGIKTVNNIKKNVKVKFKDWEERIAFLAIDTDVDDLKRQTSLAENEKHCIEADAATGSRYDFPENRSQFVKSWLNKSFFADFSLPGANQIRQACIAKLFDEAEAANPNDKKVRKAILDAANRVLENFDPRSMRMTVHIVAGISGGTGSGSVVHIAHFVRRAISLEHKIYGYLLLPDVVEQHLNGDAAQKNLYVNGYAALKELNYYYSEAQRTAPDFLETSSPAEGSKKFDYGYPLYDMLYLFNGSNGAAVPDPNKNAIETLSDSLINLLSESQNADTTTSGQAEGQLTSSFLANAAAARTAKFSELYEQDGSEKGTFECGEDIFNYNALGVASATIPEHTVKCYSVTKIMRTVFGKTNGFEAPSDFHGFSNTAMTSVEADVEIKKLLAFSPSVVEKKIWEFCNSALQWPEDFSPLKRPDILSESESDLKMQLKIDVQKTKVIQALKKYIATAYDSYRVALKEFLIKFGPMPYVKIYDGEDAAGIAYKNSIGNILSEYKVFGISSLSKIKTSSSSREKRQAYDKVKTPILGNASGIISAWHEAYRADQVMRLAEEMAGSVFGEAGIYRTMYVDLIERDSKYVKDFEFTLNKLSFVYENMGSKFDSYLTFKDAANTESATNVNIIGAESDYQWAKDIVDSRARKLNYSEIKKSIIESFMSEPDKWTEYDKTRPQLSPRRTLDAIMAPYVDTEDELTVISYINHKLIEGGDPQKIVNDLIRDMALSAVPLFNANANAVAVKSTGKSYLMVPKVMFLQEGGSQIRACFDAACKAKNITLFPSDMADKMVYYSLYTALPLYALKDLKKWESFYDASDRKMVHMNESGKGEFDKESGLAWEDYPALALVRNPRLPDATGKVSREGEFLKKKLDPLFEECLKNGIIEKKKDINDGWYYSCYVLDKPGWDISFNLREYNKKNDDGLYLLGKPVFEYLAEKNDASLEDIEKKIELRDHDAFNKPTADEKRALDRAKRTLRRNVPLYLSLKKTLAIWKELGASLLTANFEIEAGMLSKYIPYYIATGILAPNSKKLWSVNNYPTEGQSIDICSLNSLKLDEDDPLVKGECLYEILCRAFIEKMSGDANVASFYKDSYNMMAEEPEIYAKDFLQRLDSFKAEADAFMEKANSASVTVQKNLAKSLKLDEDSMEEMKNHYERLLSLYKKIKSALPED